MTVLHKPIWVGVIFWKSKETISRNKKMQMGENSRLGGHDSTIQTNTENENPNWNLNHLLQLVYGSLKQNWQSQGENQTKGKGKNKVWEWYLSVKSLGFPDKGVKERGGRKSINSILRGRVGPRIDGEFGPLNEAKNDGILLPDQRVSHWFKVHFLYMGQ